MKLKATLVIAGLLLSAVYRNVDAQTDILQAGNLESETGWSTSFLNTPGGSEPTVDWNYTTDTPTAGQGGNLHVSGLSNNSTVQYAIYQKVHLSADSLYSFDGAFKAIAMNNSWCEVYLGTAPVDGEDYGDPNFKLTAFGTWAEPAQTDGVFSKDAGVYESFAPDTSGTYYLVLKMGSTSWDGTDQSFEIMVDELSLTRERVKPFVAFTSDILTGYAPLTVQFTNESKFGVSYSWDFGDGTAAVTDENPGHIFNTPGTYTVTFTVTNEIGDSVLTKENLISVDSPVQLTGGGVIAGGNLEDASKWNTSFLNTPAGSEPTVTWNYTTDTPAAGQGGCLYVSGNSKNNTVQYAIYQQVHLSADSVYNFDGAFRDLTSSLNQFWCEVYIGAEPVDGLDYGDGNTKIAQFSTWDGGCSGIGVNGTFSSNGCTYGGYTPDITGDYFLVIKLGTTDWEGKDMPFTVALDEVSLTGVRTKPYTRFSSENPLGFAPLDVNFTNNSLFATSYSWDFGDGSAASTEENPVHTYDTPGTYTVTLTATNEMGDSAIAKADFVKVNERPQLPAGEKLYGGNMEDPNLWNITHLNETSSTTAIWNYTADTAQYGAGGSLYLSGTAKDNQSLYCIWQKVELNKDSIYHFDAAFKALTETKNFWAQVYIGTVPPVDGEDYGADSIMLVQFLTWAECTGSLVDGTFQNDGCIQIGDYVPDTTGTYYFAIKVGCNGNDNGNPVNFEVLIDEVTLQEATNVPKPSADFFTDVTEGDAPLTVYFTDLSENATSWAWDFGDGTTSTEQHPSHTYSTAGTYTVTLVATNQGFNDTITVEDIINVTGSTAAGLSKNENVKVFPNPSSGEVNIVLPDNFTGTLSVCNILGKEVYREELQGDRQTVTTEIKEHGLYFIRLISDEIQYTSKIVVKQW